MSSQQSPSTKDDSGQSVKREEALHRSLREYKTRRLTHFNPCNARRAHNAPILTSRVQWSSGISSSQGLPDRDSDYNMKDIQDSTPSPVRSDFDELVPSDDDQSLPYSRPSTCASRTDSTSRCVRLSPSWDSSDTEKHQPSFPGNRDIIDSRLPSTSPSPPTQHSAELETPSPMSDVVTGWPINKSNSSTSLDLHLDATDKPFLRDDRLARVGSWRVESILRDRRGNQSQPYWRHGSVHDSPRPSRLHYSPSISSSSTPPSPPPILPPIHHLNATLPASTGSTPGVLQWRFRESLDPQSSKAMKSVRGAIDEYDDHRSSTGSPQTLPPLLRHIDLMTQNHPTHHALPAMMPMSATPSLPQLATPVRNKNAWKDYAQLVSGPNEQTEFCCIWRVGYSGEATDLCGYTAKRHLVKRHIETRHLQFKDHICQYCGKAFPQRVSLMIHVNRHTGAKPHPCRYVDCDKTFSDPARRHKHMVEAHGYNPQGPRKRHRTVDSYHASANFGTLAPWTAKGESSKTATVET